MFFVGALALSFGALGLADAAVLDSTAQLALVNLSEPLVLSLCALMVFWMALHFAPGEPLRRQWVPIGLGLLVFALGDIVYGAYEIANGVAPPSPGLADLLYALFYPLVAVGIIRAVGGDTGGWSDWGRWSPSAVGLWRRSARPCGDPVPTARCLTLLAADRGDVGF